MAERFDRLLAATARRLDGKVALAWNGGALTWDELDRRARGVARWLAGQRVGAGATVALSIPNGWPFVAALLGALRLGATVAPLNPLLADAERQRILADLRPTATVGEAEVRDALPAAPPDAEVAPPAATDAPAIVLYTSGSTGQPKGVVLSHAALAFANRSWVGPVMALTPDDVVLAVLPLAHSFGLNGALLAPLLAGATVVLAERFAPEAVLQAIARHRVTVLPAVATMFRRLLDTPGCDPARLSSLRLAVSGAAPCPWELAEEWRGRTGVRILRGYGMTEVFRPVSYRADDPCDWPDAVGRPVPGVEVRVVDDADREVAAGEPGELWIRSPAVMDSYLHRPEETRAVLADGWFRTRDLAALRPDGFVRIVGRKRDLILRGGYSVVPGEVETVLQGHPAVLEAAVVGRPHGELGEEVTAFVTLRPAARIEPDDLVAHCKARLASYKYPREVHIVAELPAGATGKILKSRLGPGEAGTP